MVGGAESPGSRVFVGTRKERDEASHRYMYSTYVRASITAAGTGAGAGTRGGDLDANGDPAALGIVADIE